MNSVSVSLRIFKNKFFSGCKHQIVYKIVQNNKIKISSM